MVLTSIQHRFHNLRTKRAGRFAHPPVRYAAPIVLPSCADDVVSARCRCVIQTYRSSSVLLADVDFDLIYVYSGVQRTYLILRTY